MSAPAPEAPGRAAVMASLGEEYLDTIRAGVRAHPRSNQTIIGPSEIGNPCIRALLHRLHGDREAEPGEPAWAPAIGTALHAYVQGFFDAASAGEEFSGRWLTEQTVTVGAIGGQPITGSTDLWDEWSHTVIDHKFVGKSSLSDYAAHGPKKFPQYRIQAHLYARGWENAGKHVDAVMIAFVPRDGADLSKTYLWWEPYLPAIADAALIRANRLYDAMRSLGGIGALLPLYPPCESIFCHWCGNGPRRLHVPAIKPLTAQ
jgi:hypothetical protein